MPKKSWNKLKNDIDIEREKQYRRNIARSRQRDYSLIVETKLICPSCGTEKGHSFGTGDCGCEINYRELREDQFLILFPNLSNPFRSRK